MDKFTFVKPMRFTPFPVLKTKRLLLQQLTENDATAVLFLRSDSAVNQYIKRSTPKNKQDALDFIAKINNMIAADKSIYWTIKLKGNTEMIGSICLWNFSEDQKIAETGYDLHPDFQGKGIMGEALKRILAYGFGDLNLGKIEAYTHRENEPSIALLLKNDFTFLPDIKDQHNKDNSVFGIKQADFVD